jgi:hypothetical protein
VRQALVDFFGEGSTKAERFRHEDLDKLWHEAYHTREVLMEATREGLREAGLTSALVDSIVRHQGEPLPFDHINTHTHTSTCRGAPRTA